MCLNLIVEHLSGSNSQVRLLSILDIVHKFSCDLGRAVNLVPGTESNVVLEALSSHVEISELTLVGNQGKGLLQIWIFPLCIAVESGFPSDIPLVDLKVLTPLDRQVHGAGSFFGSTSDHLELKGGPWDNTAKIITTCLQFSLSLQRTVIAMFELQLEFSLALRRLQLLWRPLVVDLEFLGIAFKGELGSWHVAFGLKLSLLSESMVLVSEVSLQIIRNLEFLKTLIVLITYTCTVLGLHLKGEWLDTVVFE